MIPDSNTNHLYFSDRLEIKYPQLIALLRSALPGIPIDIIPGTADIWCRDYMPIQLDTGRYCQFEYAPDYLRCYEHLVTPPGKCQMPFMQNYEREPIVLDGGNVVASRTRIIMTEKIYQENSSIQRPRLRERLEQIFQAECVFIPKEAGDDIGHSDGVVRFVDEDRVFINDYTTVDPGYGDRVRAILEKHRLAVDTLPMFEEKAKPRRDCIASAVGIYINYLRVGNHIVVPGYGTPEDQAAMEKIKQVMPNTLVSQVPCRDLAEEGGVLNCISWTIRDNRVATA